MTPHAASERIIALARKAPVIPVLTVEDAGRARALAEALVAGGLFTLEVSLRTPQAADAIAAMADVPGATVGAGTLLNPDDARRAQDAGAAFGTSPGRTGDLMDICEAMGLPLLPGAATATESMALLDRGYTFQRFFPAEAGGGLAALTALATPLPQVTFCPQGGVGPGNAAAYLALPNSVCVAGDWVAPPAEIAAAAWDAITARAKEAADLATQL